MAAVTSAGLLAAVEGRTWLKAGLKTFLSRLTDSDGVTIEGSKWGRMLIGFVGKAVVDGPVTNEIAGICLNMLSNEKVAGDGAA